MPEKDHKRLYPYRPPKRAEDSEGADTGLVWRFIRQYILPRKWPVLVCMFLVVANSCSVYLMSFYGRIMVDTILVVKTASSEDTTSEKDSRYTEREQSQSHLPTMGMGKRMDLGFAFSDRPPGAERHLFLLAIVYIMTQLTLNGLARVSQRRRIAVGMDMMSELRDDMHRKVMELSLAYHQGHSPGRLMSRIISDVRVVQNELLQSVLDLTRCLALIIVGATILLMSSSWLGAIVFAALPLYWWVVERARPRIKELSREIRHTNACMFALATQKIDAMKAIQAYGREHHEEFNFHRLGAVQLRDAITQQRVGAKVGRSTTIIGAASQVGIFLLGAKLVMDGKLSLGEMMFVRATALTLFDPVLQLTRFGVVFSNMSVMLQRVVSVLDEPVTIKDDPDAVDVPRPLHKGIRLDHVSFSYPTLVEDETSEPVLRNLSLTVPAGTWMCVMGPSGCGKTTLLYLLSRLHDPTSGTILLDDVPLTKIRMASLRSCMGLVPQEAQIFSGTVRENICYGRPNAEPSAIMDAAKAAQLHDFILEMKVQYETLIGQKGASLSGGQRQRLSLARALLTDPEILLLDDCTSALDADTEQRIQNTLSEILVGKTAIIVSQRVSMARRCHRICTIENGTITECGTHRELVAAGGFYARLHAQQTE